jgi:beta-glucosidase
MATQNKMRRRDVLQLAAVAGAGVAVTNAGARAKDNRAMRGVMPRRREQGPAGVADAAYGQARRRAAALVAKMTLEEKISQTGNTAPALKRLGLGRYQYWSEALHGLARGYATGTSFPQPLALAGAWNPELNHRVYTAVSDEARAWHNRTGNSLTFYSPQTLNLHRDPRWGRCEEAAGEDPCLAATLAVQVIKAMQGGNPNYLKTTACAKHFICNNTDDDRMSVSATVDPRSFWEYYTRAFRAAVIDGGVFTAMGAYNAVNGIPCCADHFLLTDLLRKRWGFRGYVTSDCDAIYNIYNPHHYAKTLPQAAADAIHAGCDLNCGSTLQKYLAPAVQRQLVGEAEITQAVTRILTARFLLGEFDPPAEVPYSRISFDVVNSQAHQALALEAARQSMILLKNEGDFLPLDKTKLATIAVIGPMAGQTHLGQYSGGTYETVSPLQGIGTVLGVPVAGAGVWPDQAMKYHATRLQTTMRNRPSFAYITNGAWMEYQEQEFTGKTGIDIECSSARAGGTITVHLDALENPAIAAIHVPNTGGWQNWKKFSAPLHGVTGRHKVFFQISGGDGDLLNIGGFELLPLAPPEPGRPGHPEIIYKTGCSISGPKDPAMFADAVSAAKKADVVILVCGVNSSVDGEGHDRKDTNLTGSQHELIQAVYAANPRCVLVISSNNTVAINWEQAHIPAILGALFAGQAQGAAIADVLFGNYNPGGKTCCTWYQSVNELPPFHDYDIRKGRTYMYFEGRALYPFGYGLSYTRFKFSGMNIIGKSLSPGGAIQVSTTVTNTGKRSGAEVVQFYVKVPRSKIKRPIRELVGFARVEIPAGESRHVTFTLPYNQQALWYWDIDKKKFALTPGALRLEIGNSSADIHHSGSVQLHPCTDGALGGPETLNTLAVPVEVQ